MQKPLLILLLAACFASLYRLSDKEIIRCDSAFYDDSVYSSEISFDYRLDNDLKSDPAFALEGNVLICPVFGEDSRQLIGRKQYRLMPNGR